MVAAPLRPDLAGLACCTSMIRFPSRQDAVLLEHGDEKGETLCPSLLKT